MHLCQFTQYQENSKNKRKYMNRERDDEYQNLNTVVLLIFNENFLLIRIETKSQNLH